MIPYHYYFYLSFEQQEKTELENVFDDLINKIILYQKQYEMTIKLFNSELNNESLLLKNQFAKSEKFANEVYKKAYEELEGEDDYVRNSYASHKSGIENLNYSFYEDNEKLKNRYDDFFDLYSKSLFTSLYSVVESKLKEVCDIISRIFDHKLKYEHLDSRDYLNTSMNYLELVTHIPTTSLINFISKLKQMQFIRNRIIHADSKFTDTKEQTIKDIVTYWKGALFLKKHETFHVLTITDSKFIFDFSNLIKEFSEELFWLIDNKQKNKILLKGLEYWFGLLDRKF